MAVLASSPAAVYGLAPVGVSFPAATNVGANTYDLCTASGDLTIVSAVIVVGAVAVTGLVSVSVQTNDVTVATILSAGEGVVASLTANTTVKTFTTAFVLHSGKKVQYTTVGVGLGGSLAIVFSFIPHSRGTVLT